MSRFHRTMTFLGQLTEVLVLFASTARALECFLYRLTQLIQSTRRRRTSRTHPGQQINRVIQDAARPLCMRTEDALTLGLQPLQLLGQRNSKVISVGFGASQGKLLLFHFTQRSQRDHLDQPL